MINATSPTIAAMIDNTPQGIGNMPYNPQMVPNYGTVGYQPNPSFNSPYPSPKDMLTQAGQMNVYQPTTFASPFAPPQNIIGGYNPGYNAAFNGYANPYMGYGYSGYNPAIYNPQILMAPPQQFQDTITMSIYETSQRNGISYKDQLFAEAEITKKLTSMVSRFQGMDEEKINELCSAYDIYDRTKPFYEEPEQPKKKPEHEFKAVFVDQDGTEYHDERTKTPEEVSRELFTYEANAKMVDYKIAEANREKELNDMARRSLYNKSVARKYDHTPFAEFVNEGGLAEVVLESRAMREAQILDDRRKEYEAARRQYDQDRFRQMLERSAEGDGINRPVGMLPDGRYISPYHDPSISNSFSTNPNGHTCDITMPENLGRQNNYAIDRNGQTEIVPAFTANNYESARIHFIKTLEDQNLPKV